MDDFGMNLVRSNTGPIDNNDVSGGRFATFPVKARPAAITHTPTFALDPLPLQTRHDLGPSFALSIADALEHKDHPDPFADGTSVSNTTLSPSTLPSTSNIPSASPNPWVDDAQESSRTQLRQSHLSDNDDALLAYMMSGDDEGTDSAAQQSLQISQRKVSSELQDREERLGEVHNPEQKSDKRISMVEDKRVSGSPSLGRPVVAGITVEREDGKRESVSSISTPLSE
jgi:hypothetical protein